jgi:hypothetical protein
VLLWHREHERTERDGLLMPRAEVREHREHAAVLIPASPRSFENAYPAVTGHP